MKKLLMVAGVMSFLALSFSVQGVNDNLTNFDSSDGEKCEVFTNMKGEKMKRCCLDHIIVENDKVLHTRKCRTEPLLGS